MGQCFVDYWDLLGYPVKRIEEDPDVTPRDMVIKSVPSDTGGTCSDDVPLRSESGKPVVCA